MVIFTLPHIPENVYRIQSAVRLSPPLCLERQSNGEIKPSVLDTASTNQQWRVVYQDDGTYRIVNAKTYESLCIVAAQHKGQTYFSLGSGGPQLWTFDARGNAFIIGDPVTGACLDIQPSNWVVSQSRTNAASQLWTLHSVEPGGSKTNTSHSENVKPNSYEPDSVKDSGSATWKRPPSPSQSVPTLPPRPPPVIPTPPPRAVSPAILANGNYDIVNVATRHPFFPSFGTIPDDSDQYFMRKKKDTRPASFSSWTVENIPAEGKDVFRITGSLHGRPVSLFNFKDYGRPDRFVVCHGGQRTCRLVPAKLPGCFHLVGDSEGVVKAVYEWVAPTDQDTAAEVAIFKAEDKRQQWRFVPA